MWLFMVGSIVVVIVVVIVSSMLGATDHRSSIQVVLQRGGRLSKAFSQFFRLFLARPIKE
jgi:hypothetical protein